MPSWTQNLPDTFTALFWVFSGLDYSNCYPICRSKGLISAHQGIKGIQDLSYNSFVCLKLLHLHIRQTFMLELRMWCWDILEITFLCISAISVWLEKPLYCAIYPLVIISVIKDRIINYRYSLFKSILPLHFTPKLRRKAQGNLHYYIMVWYCPHLGPTLKILQLGIFN